MQDEAFTQLNHFALVAFLCTPSVLLHPCIFLPAGRLISIMLLMNHRGLRCLADRRTLFAGMPPSLCFLTGRIFSVAVALLLGVMALISPAMAQENSTEEKHPIDKWMQAELDKASSTSETREVLRKALAKWDTELNSVYKELTGVLKPAGKEALKAAQVQWMKFRDAEIAFIKESIYALDGTMWLQVGDDRVMELTRERTLQLRRTLQTMKDGATD